MREWRECPKCHGRMEMRCDSFRLFVWPPRLITQCCWVCGCGHWEMAAVRSAGRSEGIGGE